jgi:hypothetical protein
MSLLSLYIFADKYSVTQLRDDIMSALMGHCIRWSRWPSSVSNSLLISSAYEHLPSNSDFCRFLAVLVAYLWESRDEDDSRTVLSELPPKFMVEVIILLSSMDGARYEFTSYDSDSCSFHEHANHTRSQCRQRLSNCGHVFSSIINACSQEAKKMVAQPAPSTPVQE